MNARYAVSALAALAWLAAEPLAAQPLSTTFTYQGRLENAGSPAGGLHNLRFRLYDALAGGTQIGATLCVDNVNVADGLFTVPLDFGAQFAGQQRFLEIDVRADAGLDCGNPAGFVILAPRQQLTGAPNALFALSVASAAAATTAIDATQLNGQLPAFYQNASNINSGTLADARLSANVALLGGAQTFTGPKTFSGGLATNAFTLTPGAGAGKVLTSDGAGIATWQTAAGLTLPYTESGSNAAALFKISNTSTGQGLRGESSLGIGVFGYSSPAGSTSAGVVGQSEGSASYGVFGQSLGSAGTGVYGYGTWGNRQHRRPRRAWQRDRDLWNRLWRPFRQQQSGWTGCVRREQRYNGAVRWREVRERKPRWTRRLRHRQRDGGPELWRLFREQRRQWARRDRRRKRERTTGQNIGGYFESHGASGIAVYGLAGATTGSHYGGYFVGSNSTGVYGTGVYGGFFESNNTGVFGSGNAAGSNAVGVYGVSYSASGSGVYGTSYGTGTAGVYGRTSAANGNVAYGVFGHNNGNPSAWALFAQGDIGATGTKAFNIDHPLDPENKYLKHYCAEGPEPKNVYDGTVRTDASGYAAISLPDYYEQINRDARIQLTVVDEEDSDGFVMAKVVQKVQGNGFRIRTSAPNVEVFWRVEAVRNDLYVRKYGAPVEVEKQEPQRGKYQHPELYGQPPEKGMNYDATRDRPEQQRPPAASPGTPPG